MLWRDLEARCILGGREFPRNEHLFIWYRIAVSAASNPEGKERRWWDAGATGERTPPEGEAAATRARKLPAEGDKSLTGSRASVAGVAVLRPYERVLASRQRLMPQRNQIRARGTAGRWPGRVDGATARCAGAKARHNSERFYAERPLVASEL